jgi:hypothetical protein
MKILVGYFNAKLGREVIFKLKIGNESLHGTKFIPFLMKLDHQWDIK